MALPESLRPVPPPAPTDPTEIKLVSTGTTVTFVGLVYTASLSPFVQGVEIKDLSQLVGYTQLKTRGNISFVTALNGVVQRQNFFNSLLEYESIGIAGSGSMVSLDTSGRVTEVLDHVIEKRDLGQTPGYEGNDPYEECDNFNPVNVIKSHAITFVQPISLVNAGSQPSSFDGVIEPFDIRKIADRTSIEMPYISHSVKGDISITNVKRESLIVDDKVDLRDDSTRPFYDSQESFAGLIDLPGVFSDAESNIGPYTEVSQRELFYKSGILDNDIRNVMIQGIVSASITYRSNRTNNVRSSVVIARHGFVYSQNDNYGYDSIVYGGLKK